ncbi:hypothetical protein I546_7357 [Mycobacterium kansasii 732]|nr:hypothetical protein I546_7357 [Mycobacterium kansasii 732]
MSRRLDEAAGIVVRDQELPREQWEVTIPDHHPGYVSWQTYLANQDRLRANVHPPKGQGGGAVREGRALLQGWWCAASAAADAGRLLRPRWPSPTVSVRAGTALYGSARSCQSLSGRRLDAAVVEEMFTVLQPPRWRPPPPHWPRPRISMPAGARVRAGRRAGPLRGQRARRQFDAVEPENRLVARSLERDWEVRLGTLRQAEADLAAQQSRRRRCSPRKRWPGYPTRVLTCGRCSTPTPPPSENESSCCGC